MTAPWSTMTSLLTPTIHCRMWPYVLPNRVFSICNISIDTVSCYISLLGPWNGPTGEINQGDFEICLLFVCAPSLKIPCHKSQNRNCWVKNKLCRGIPCTCGGYGLYGERSKYERRCLQFYGYVVIICTRDKTKNYDQKQKQHISTKLTVYFYGYHRCHPNLKPRGHHWREHWLINIPTFLANADIGERKDSCGHLRCHLKISLNRQFLFGGNLSKYSLDHF